MRGIIHIQLMTHSHTGQKQAVTPIVSFPGVSSSSVSRVHSDAVAQYMVFCRAASPVQNQARLDVSPSSTRFKRSVAPHLSDEGISPSCRS